VPAENVDDLFYLFALCEEIRQAELFRDWDPF